MIIDSHSHIFQNWMGACGLPSREIHWKHIQKIVARPAAKVFRARDGAPAEASPLTREGDSSWAGLRDDVEFRVGRYGRLEFIVDGEDYYVQYMPVAMAEFESTPEFMLTQMNAAGIDRCVLQAGFSYGYMNDYNALAQREYPDRFVGLMHVDEPKADTPYWLAEVDRAHHKLGLKGLHYHLQSFSRYGFETYLDDDRYDPFWTRIEDLDIPIFLELAAIPNNDEASYVELINRFDGLATRFPKIRWLLVMAGPINYFARDGRWHFPEPVAKAYARDNVWLELCYPISWGGTWDYPYPELQDLIKGLYDAFGAAKLIWGSDMPNVERFCTYKQSLDYVRRYCAFLSAGEKDMILGDNVAALCGIE